MGKEMGYHCLDCGTLLDCVNATESTDKYYCEKCKKHWFKVRHIIVEWIDERFKAPAE